MKRRAETQHPQPEITGIRSPAIEYGVLPFTGRPRPMADRFSRPLPASVPRLDTQEAVETMQAMSQFAGKIAHHLNNMLTVVGGNTAYLESELSGQGFDAELNDIRDACGRATELASRLLTISGRRWAEPRVVDLRALVSDMDLGRFISGDVVFCTEFAAARCRVRVDPAHLRDVVTELVLNARDAVHGRGSVRVGVEHLPSRSTENGSSAGWVELEVSDTGCGMDEETLSRAFHPFFSTHSFSEHRGLGLSVAHGIVRQCGGTMRIASAPGRGTTVRVWLPAVASISVSQPV